MKRDDTMGNYETITLRSHRFDKIIEVLEKTCERSDNFIEIEDLVGLINHIEEERDSYWAKANKEFRKEIKWERTMDSFCRFLVEEEIFNKDEIAKIRADYYKALSGE